LEASYDLVVDETPNELMLVQALEGVPYIASSIYWMSHMTQLWINPKLWMNPKGIDMGGGLIYSTLSIYLSIHLSIHPLQAFCDSLVDEPQMSGHGFHLW